MNEDLYSIESAETERSLIQGRNSRLRRLRFIFWTVALVLGFIHAWADHHYLRNADAMCYLDVADAYLRRDWHTAINAYWSPLYSWLIGLALLIVKPSPYWKFSVLHLTNFAIYLLALVCFDFLIRELIGFQRERGSKLLASKLVTLPDWACLALGYALFLWSSLFLIGVSEESPDLLVASLVYLAAGILLRIRRKRQGWVAFVFLGIALGVGYLAKTVMLPLSFVFLAAALFSVGNLRRALPRVLAAMAVLLLVAGPFIFAISRARGRLTIGDSGRLNYLWVIDGDAPENPTRKIFDKPAIYEFGSPIGGTNPVWYDPSYWYAGSVSHFNLRGQLRALARSAASYYELLHLRGVQYGLLVGFLSLYLMSRRRWLLLYDLAPYLFLIVPALSGLAIYSLINVQGRYVAPFIVLLWLTLFSGLRLPDSSESKRLIACVATVLMGMMVVIVTASSSREARLTAHYLIAGEDVSAHPQWQVAEGLRQMGVEPGDKVAVVSNPDHAYWAHLAGLHIVAEIVSSDADPFWAADSAVKNRAMETLANTGAKAIVTPEPPLCADATGWRKLGNTNYYVYLLSRQVGVQLYSVKPSSVSQLRFPFFAS